MTKREFADWLENNGFAYVGETEDNKTKYVRRMWDVTIATNGMVAISSAAFPRTFHGNVDNHIPLIEHLS